MTKKTVCDKTLEVVSSHQFVVSFSPLNWIAMDTLISDSMTILAKRCDFSTHPLGANVAPTHPKESNVSRRISCHFGDKMQRKIGLIMINPFWAPKVQFWRLVFVFQTSSHWQASTWSCHPMWQKSVSSYSFPAWFPLVAVERKSCPALLACGSLRKITAIFSVAIF